MRIKDFSEKLAEEYLKLDDGLKKKHCLLLEFAKPNIKTISILTGKIDMIEKLGGVISNVISEAVSKIPNNDVRDKLIDHIVDRGKYLAERVNRIIGVGREMVDTAKNGWDNQIKPAIPSPSINNQNSHTWLVTIEECVKT